MADEPETTVAFKPNDASIKSVDELMKRDQEDESLNKWKASLLGKALSEDISPKDDPRRVVIKEMAIVTEENGTTTHKLDNKEQLEKLKDSPFILKEGCHFKAHIVFKVQHELVTGLKYVNTVYRKGIRVGKEETMIGSFPPQAESHVVDIPRRGYDEAPSGLLARGTYKAHVKFVDDDNQVHLEYDYTFSIKKDWKSSDPEEDKE